MNSKLASLGPAVLMYYPLAVLLKCYLPFLLELVLLKITENGLVLLYKRWIVVSSNTLNAKGDCTKKWKLK